MSTANPPASPPPDRIPLQVWLLSGGTGPPPSTPSFLRMTRQRNDQAAASAAWTAARKDALRRFEAEWGRGGQRPRELRKWHREWKARRGKENPVEGGGDEGGRREDGEGQEQEQGEERAVGDDAAEGEENHDEAGGEGVVGSNTGGTGAST